MIIMIINWHGCSPSRPPSEAQRRGKVVSILAHLQSLKLLPGGGGV